LIEYIDDIQAEIGAISIGFPSNLNKERSLIISTPNIKGFDNVRIQPQFEEHFKIPVLIEKDTCMLIHYDLRKVDFKKGILIGFYIGTGIGNIILVDGKILTGKDGVAGELGHIPVLDKYDQDTCGLKGCAELYAGGKGLEDIRRTYFSETHIADIFVKHRNTPEIIAFIEKLAKIIVVEIHILNPDHIILGGGVIAMDCFPYEQLVDRIHEFTRKPLPEETLNITRSETTNPYNGVIGAAFFAINNLKERIKNDSIS